MRNPDAWKEYPGLLDTINCVVTDCKGDNAIYNSNTYYYDKQVEAGQVPPPINGEATLPGHPEIEDNSKIESNKMLEVENEVRGFLEKIKSEVYGLE